MDVGGDEDRDAILARRQALVAVALASLAGCGSTPPPPAAEPKVCLSVRVEEMVYEPHEPVDPLYPRRPRGSVEPETEETETETEETSSGATGADSEDAEPVVCLSLIYYKGDHEPKR